MTFSEAFTVIREDGAKAMRLPKWNNDVRVKVQNLDGTLCNTHPYLYVESRFGRVPWIPNYVELFAKEWEVTIRIMTEAE